MTDEIKFVITQQGLCIQFENMMTKNEFMQDMLNHGIDMFIQNTEPFCYVQSYPNKNQMGQFISKEQRLGLAFSTEKQKFHFKEYLGLSSECFMDMGPGYDAQMHFNEKFLPCLDGVSMIIRR